MVDQLRTVISWYCGERSGWTGALPCAGDNHPARSARRTNSRTRLRGPVLGCSVLGSRVLRVVAGMASRGSLGEDLHLNRPCMPGVPLGARGGLQMSGRQRQTDAGPRRPVAPSPKSTSCVLRSAVLVVACSVRFGVVRISRWTTHEAGTAPACVDSCALPFSTGRCLTAAPPESGGGAPNLRMLSHPRMRLATFYARTKEKIGRSPQLRSTPLAPVATAPARAVDKWQPDRWRSGAETSSSRRRRKRLPVGEHSYGEAAATASRPTTPARWTDAGLLTVDGP